VLCKIKSKHLKTQYITWLHGDFFLDLAVMAVAALTSEDKGVCMSDLGGSTADLSGSTSEDLCRLTSEELG